MYMCGLGLAGRVGRWESILPRPSSPKRQTRRRLRTREGLTTSSKERRLIGRCWPFSLGYIISTMNEEERDERIRRLEARVEELLLQQLAIYDIVKRDHRAIEGLQQAALNGGANARQGQQSIALQDTCICLGGIILRRRQQTGETWVLLSVSESRHYQTS